MSCCWPYLSMARLAWDAVGDVEHRERKGIQSSQIQSHIIALIPGGVRCLTRLCLGHVSQFHLPEKAVGRHGVHKSTAAVLPLLPFHQSWEFKISQCARTSCPRPPASLTKYTLKCNFESCIFFKILLNLVTFFAINVNVKTMPWTKTLDSEFCFPELFFSQFGCPEKDAVCHREPWPLWDLEVLLLNLGHKLGAEGCSSLKGVWEHLLCSLCCLHALPGCH